MDFSTICRTCLGTEYLNPIFKNITDHSHYSSAIYITTGLKVQLNDGLPQKMCLDCMTFVNNCLSFQRRSRETETLLLKINNNQFISDIKQVADKKAYASNIHQESNVKTEDVLKSEHIDCSISLDDFKTESNINLDDEDKPLKYLLECSDNITTSDYSDIIIKEELNKTNSNDHEMLPEHPLQDMLVVNQKSRRVICKLCQKNLSIRSIDAHMAKRHPGADERKIKCELCDKYVTKQKLNRHKVMMHGSGQFKCGYCKTEFDNKEVLVEHVPTCTEKRKKRKASDAGRELRECDICNKTMQKASLRMHKAIKHAGLGPVCEHCGKRFGNKFRLNEHLRAKHGYEKFKCSTCEFQSAGAMAMRNHERRHRGEKPFSCETCGAKFHAAYLLAQHKQSHRTEKLHKCDQCPASFKANNSLHMHKLTCHSNALYKCIMCGRAYSCRHYAVKHLRAVHRYSGPVPPLQRLPTAVDAAA